MRRLQEKYGRNEIGADQGQVYSLSWDFLVSNCFELLVSYLCAKRCFLIELATSIFNPVLSLLIKRLLLVMPSLSAQCVV